MVEHTYTDPVAKLLPLGDTNIRSRTWRNYLAMGFTNEHIPELMRLMTDTGLAELPWIDGEPFPEVYAQIHAWRVLGQLKAVEAIPALLGLLHEIDDDENDWADDDIPIALGIIGAAAIQPSLEYLLNPSHGTYARIAAATTLSEVGTRHPETRDDCVRALIAALEKYQENDETVNAFVISYLMSLKAAEAAPLVEKVYREARVEIGVCGDYEEFQIQVGLLKKRLTASPFTSEAELKRLLGGKSTRGEARKYQGEKVKKEKAKAKQAKKVRKKNKKR